MYPVKDRGHGTQNTNSKDDVEYYKHYNYSE
jgi:hypothetical protein